MQQYDPLSMTMPSKQSGTITNKQNESKSLFSKEQRQAITPVTLLLINKCLQSNTKQLDGIQLNKIIIVGRIKDIKSSMSRSVLSVCDETDNGRVISSNLNSGDDLEIGPYYEFYIILKQDKEEYIMLLEKYVMITDLEAISNHYLKVIKADIERRNMKK